MGPVNERNFFRILAKSKGVYLFLIFIAKTDFTVSMRLSQFEFDVGTRLGLSETQKHENRRSQGEFPNYTFVPHSRN